MQTYIDNLNIALIIFPLAAAVFTVPYALHQYRKFGGMPLLRVVIVYSMILYMICAYCMVILPLPTEQTLAAAAPVPQLTPFHFLVNFFEKSGFVAGTPSTFWPALTSSAGFVVAFNVLLLLPLGVYLRYYFSRRWHQALVISFCVSLFFELTQLTGLYGIYPHAYRLFDVDDLLLNTLGGMCGFWIEPLLTRLLPTRDRLDALSYKKGERVTLTRRIVACWVDWFCIISLALLTDILFGLLRDGSGSAAFLLTALYSAVGFILIPCLTGGRTLGKFLVGIKLERTDGLAPRPWQYLVRYGVLYGLVIAEPALALLGKYSDLLGPARYVFALALVFGVMAAVCIFTVHFFETGIRKENRFWYEKWSGTRNVSTVRAPQKEEN